MDPEEALNAFFLLNDDDLSDSGESDISDDDHLLLLSDGSSGDQSDSSSRTLSESSSAESEDNDESDDGDLPGANRGRGRGGGHVRGRGRGGVARGGRGRGGAGAAGGRRRGRGGAGALGRGRGRGTAGHGRGRGRGGAQGRGIGRGRGRGGAGGLANFSEWDNVDDNGNNAAFDFIPDRAPGLHLPEHFNAEAEVDFFKLFFSDEVITSLTQFTNAYAWNHIVDHPSHALSDGSWEDCTNDEMQALIALLIYFGLVRVQDVKKYWSNQSLYNGLWARGILSRRRFMAIRAFFQCSPPDGDPEDRLRKVRFIYDHVRNKSREYWQPNWHVCIDERMVRFKGRNVMKVYVKQKPVKWGFKSYTLCDSETAYNCYFEMYTGQNVPPGEHGLTHDLVMRLMQPYVGQGYRLFTDNYYTSHALAESLIASNTDLVGTVRSNRHGFPDRLKQSKHFERHGARGDMRYERVGRTVYVQWLDKRSVTVLSTFHVATDAVQVPRMVKVGGAWQQQLFPKPAAVDCYNRYMGGVDVFDQLASTHRLLRRAKKFTKVIFYDIVEIAIINAFKLMGAWMEQHPEVIVRGGRYSQSEFRENLVRQLGGIGLHDPPPQTRKVKTTAADHSNLHVEHVPLSAGKGDCAVCWKVDHARVSSVFSCAKCRNRKGNRVHLCIKPNKNCFQFFHSPQFDPFR